MARRGYSPKQIIGMLREAEVLLSQGMTAREAARKLGISEHTYSRWQRD